MHNFAQKLVKISLNCALSAVNARVERDFDQNHSVEEHLRVGFEDLGHRAIRLKLLGSIDRQI